MKNKGRCVLVTGASGGIGAAIARAFAKNGDSVALGCHNNVQKAQMLESELLALNHSVMLAQGDVSDAASVEAMFAQIESRLGPVEILINNAGISRPKLACDITPQEWDTMMNIHARGTFLCCKRALPAMIRDKRGCIINISSMWGQVGASCESDYSAAKGAVIALTKALAKEEGPSGIRVNCVAPGAVDTAMMEGFSPSELQALCEDIPLGRLAQPQEVADAVLFLASNSASYITGQVLGVNGGMVV